MARAVMDTEGAAAPLAIRDAGKRPAEAPALSAFADRTDEALARRSQEGSLAAFGTLVDRYERRLVGFLMGRAPDRSMAEDLAQETFVRAWMKIESFDCERRFSTWLFTIAAKIAADHRRKARRGRLAHNGAAIEGAARLGTGARAAEGEGGDIWQVARAALSPEQMEAMWLRYVMEMRASDIAAALGRTRVGTRVLLFRARERLASALEGSKNGTDGYRAGQRRTDRPATEMGS